MRVRLDAAGKDLLLAAALLLGAGAAGGVAADVHGRAAGDPGRRRRGVRVGGGAAPVSARRRARRSDHLGGDGIFVSCPSGPVTIAWFCALYALAVWTSARWFVVGVAWFAVSDVAPELVKQDNLDAIAAFTVGAVVVMVLLRRVVGDRDRRLASRRAGAGAGDAGGGHRGAGADRARVARRDRPPRVDDGRAGRGRAPDAGAWAGVDARGADHDRTSRSRRADRDATPGRHVARRRGGRVGATARGLRPRDAGRADALGGAGRRATDGRRAA